MVSWQTLCLLSFLIASVNCQISFGDDEKVKLPTKTSPDLRQKPAPDESKSTKPPSSGGQPPANKAQQPAATVKATTSLLTVESISINSCTCVRIGSCATSGSGSFNTDGSGVIDLRVVNNQDTSSKCPSGYHCCSTGSTTDSSVSANCGLPNVLPTPGYTLSSSQAKFGEFPWTAIILDSVNKYISGAVLVSKRHVVTAAHKLNSFLAGDLKVRLGEWDVNSNSESFMYFETSVSRIAIYPLFNSANLQNDIAMLTLTDEVDLNAYPNINVVCPAQSVVSYVSNSNCWVTGWGKDAFGSNGAFQSILKKVNVPVVDSNNCQTLLRQTKLTSSFVLDRTSFICAGGVAGQDACTGDGGSPLVCERNGRYELVGLVAWGIGCAEESVPGVYVNVGSYSGWLAGEQV